MRDLEFEREWRFIEPKLRRRAWEHTKERESAEDLLQDTRIRAYRAKDNFDDSRSFLNWNMKIMERLFLDRIRSSQRRVPTMSYDALPDMDLVEAVPDPESVDKIVLDEMVFDKQLSLIDKLTAQLSDAHRETIAAYKESESTKEVSERLGLGLATSRTRVHRACKALRKLVVSQ